MVRENAIKFFERDVELLENELLSDCRNSGRIKECLLDRIEAERLAILAIKYYPKNEISIDELFGNTDKMDEVSE